MKQFKITFAMFIILVSCADNHSETIKRKGEQKQRIYGKESTVYRSVDYHIIEVDGVEYITTYSGGFYPLIKK
jgi:hypothetical protein